MFDEISVYPQIDLNEPLHQAVSHRSRLRDREFGLTPHVRQSASRPSKCEQEKIRRHDGQQQQQQDDQRHIYRMLSFDEFHAINERERSKQHEKKLNETKVPEEKLTQKSRPSSSGLGEFLEMHEMQAVVIALLVMDTFASFAEVASHQSSEMVSLLESDSRLVMFKLIRSFTTFTVFFFALEIVALFLVFQFKFFGHLGYICDAIIVCIQLNDTIRGSGLKCRLLNIFRFWRTLRLFNSLVNVERDAHNDTKKSLEALQMKRLSLEDKIKTSAEDLKKEQVNNYLSNPDVVICRHL